MVKWIQGICVHSGSYEEVGRVIKESVIRDYFQGYEVDKGNHYLQWALLPNTALRGREKGLVTRTQKPPENVDFGRQIQLLADLGGIKPRFILLPSFVLLQVPLSGQTELEDKRQGHPRCSPQGQLSGTWARERRE